jgi:hypothetical protein
MSSFERTELLELPPFYSMAIYHIYPVTTIPIPALQKTVGWLLDPQFAQKNQAEPSQYIYYEYRLEAPSHSLYVVYQTPSGFNILVRTSDNYEALGGVDRTSLVPPSYEGTLLNNSNEIVIGQAIDADLTSCQRIIFDIRSVATIGVSTARSRIRVNAPAETTPAVPVPPYALPRAT